MTTRQYLRFDPQTGAFYLLDTISGVAAKTLPVPAASFPADITNASVAASGDGHVIYGMGSSTGTFTFLYDVESRTVRPGGVVLASGTLGPRTVSLNGTGTTKLVGWVMVDQQGTFINNIPYSDNEFSVGTTVFDDKRFRVYAHIPRQKNDAPILQVLAGDNLQVLDRLYLTENTTGRSIMNKDFSVMYATSDSGVLVLPIGSLDASPRLASSEEDLVFRAGFCDGGTISRQFTLSDPNGAKTPFKITSPNAGVSVSPSSGTTPAVITVTATPSSFSNTGTLAVNLNITSTTSVNVPPTVRVLISRPTPDQKGTVLNIPGTLSDLVVDPSRDRYYVLRQDTNSVLVFDAGNNTKIATLRTYNVPSRMAMTMDRKRLLVGHNESQTVAVFDLDTLRAEPYISSEAGNGDVVTSLAVTNRDIWATAIDYQGNGHLIRMNLDTRTAVQPGNLGNWENKVNADAVSAVTDDGTRAFFLAADGSTYQYDANVDTFTISRTDKIFTTVKGSYAASNSLYAAANVFLNTSLVPGTQVDLAGASSSGIAFLNGNALITFAANSQNRGTIELVNPLTGEVRNPTSLVEAPIAATPTGEGSTSVFVRALALQSNRNQALILSVSGLIALPLNFDQPVATPLISRVVSAADGVSAPASGGLITLYGTNFTGANLAATQFPLSGTLGDVCITANGQPIPLLYVSSTQVNGQMPYEATGSVTMILRNRSAASDTFNVAVNPVSPAVFLSGQAGGITNLPTVFRGADNLLVTPANPVRRGDVLVIYLTGLGSTSPGIGTGAPAPFSPPVSVSLTPTVRLGNFQLPLFYAGATPGTAGVYQINANVPPGVPIGLSIPLVIQQGTATFSTNVRVVE